MSRIRPFEEEDIDPVADLWLKVFRGRRVAAPDALKRYFNEIFFRHPFPNEGIRSLVCEATDGRIIGFIGAMPRRMDLGGRLISVAVATQLMVDPEGRHPLAVFELVRTLFQGPQDLTYSDGAFDQATRIWRRMGGRAALLYSLEWTKVLAPTQLAATLLVKRERPWSAPLIRALRPVGKVVDKLAARVPFGPLHVPETRLFAEEALPEALLEAEAACKEAALRARHDEREIAWVLRMAAETTGHGTLRNVVLRDETGKRAGGAVYYAKPGGIAHVLHLWSHGPGIQRVLAHLFGAARAEGAIAVSGQLDPAYLRELSDTYCRFVCRGLGVLIHSRHREIEDTILRGEARLSRLDGEWWLRFGADSFEPAAA